MKKFLVFALVLCLAGSSSAALKLHWEFENNTNDSSGTGNHGAWTGTAGYAAGLPGKGGQAASFNGASYVSDPTPTGLPYSMGGSMAIRGPEFSFMCFVKGDAPWGDWDGIFGWGPYSDNRDRTMSTRGGVGFWYHGYINNVISSVPDFTDGQWHQIAVVFDQYDPSTSFYGDIILYADGAQVAISTNNHTYAITSAVPVWAGYWINRPGTDKSYWNGLIDECMIFDHALTATDIATYDLWRVPEPATIVLLGLGGLALLRKRR